MVNNSSPLWHQLHLFCPFNQHSYFFYCRYFGFGVYITFPGAGLLAFGLSYFIASSHITTQPPDNEMIEIGLVAMKAALDMDLSEHNVTIIEE